MKNLLLSLFFVCSISYAVEIHCNNGNSDAFGIPNDACHAYSDNYTFGLIQPPDGSPSYYFVDFHDVTFTIGSEENVLIRYLIFSNEAIFNGVQAITQTAYATNSRLHIIFKNPELQQNLTTNGPNGRKLCQRYGGAGSSMVCHVDAISIAR
jgi:hypothetical protein